MLFVFYSQFYWETSISTQNRTPVYLAEKGNRNIIVHVQPQSIQHKISISPWQERFLSLILFSVLRHVQGNNHNYLCMSWQAATIFASADSLALPWNLLPESLALRSCLSFESLRHVIWFPLRFKLTFKVLVLVSGYVLEVFFNKSVRAPEQTCPKQAEGQFAVTLCFTNYQHVTVICWIQPQFKIKRRIILTTIKTPVWHQDKPQFTQTKWSRGLVLYLWCSAHKDTEPEMFLC